MYDQLDPSFVMYWITNIAELLEIFMPEQKHFFSYWIGRNNGSSSGRNTKGSSLKPNNFIFLDGGGLKRKYHYIANFSKSTWFKISIFSSFSQHLPYGNNNMPIRILTFSCASPRQHYPKLKFLKWGSESSAWKQKPQKQVSRFLRE